MGKLKAALENNKGVDHKLEKQKKLRKQAAKRKRTAASKNEDAPQLDELDISRIDDTDTSADEKNDFDSEADEPEDPADANGVSLNAKQNGAAHTNGGAEQDDEDEEDEEAEDIPYSDIASLSSDDRGDVVPYQRLTINNHAALTASLARIALPLTSLPFSAHQTITSAAPIEIKDEEDDLTRELAFYAQSQAAVLAARAALTKEGSPFARPADYFAEMVKSEEHMGRVRARLVEDAANKKSAAEARRQRDLKKFGKAVQVAKLQERDKQKRETMEKIGSMKRKRSNALPERENENDMFDVQLDTESKKPSRSGDKDQGKTNHKRQKKNEKYGFGGKKRHAKSGDAQSTSDMRDFSAKGMKSKPFTGGRKRPGKARRASAK
ncbi:Ebp2-domain-containing protein [Microthyrium microscopicum]|uniref:Ebp2-domain-containing protein n=1 Tax=Microthyrium microscopicum TaxID=703497 RepID=A0A6A6TX87_9PEZI|nr:Ebp2-domain-containing protein [Microthyrium microscopicum]